MMNLQELIDYCLSKDGAVIDFPFGDKPVCLKFGGRIFAEVYPDPDDFKITLRCDPVAGEYFRNLHPGTVLPGYHVPVRQRRFKNTVLLDRDLDDGEIKAMIDHSYGTLSTGGKKTSWKKNSRSPGREAR